MTILMTLDRSWTVVIPLHSRSLPNANHAGDTARAAVEANLGAGLTRYVPQW
jgi:hypothetical protein